MTNLMRWLMYASAFCAVYIVVVAEIIHSPALNKWLFHLQLLPIALLLLFGLYAASIILYRTLTFNDCPEAAKELHEQIEEVRRDLISKGFSF